MRCIENNKLGDAIRIAGGRPPGDEPAPIVADDGKRPAPERIGQSDDILRQRVEVVGASAFGLVAEMVAALIRHEHPKAGIRQRTDLIAPSPPEFGKAVEQDHERPVRRPRLDGMKRHAVDPMADARRLRIEGLDHAWADTFTRFGGSSTAMNCAFASSAKRPPFATSSSKVPVSITRP